MFSTLSKQLDKLYKLSAWASGILLVLLCVLILYSIVARFFGLYSGGASDFAGYVMATSTFLALSYTFRSYGHIRVSLFLMRVNKKLRHGIEVFCLVIMSAVTIFMAYHMTFLAIESYEYQERSEGADAVLLWIPQTPVAIGSILFALSVVHCLILSIKRDESANSFEQYTKTE